MQKDILHVQGLLTCILYSVNLYRETETEKNNKYRNRDSNNNWETASDRGTGERRDQKRGTERLGPRGGDESHRERKNI